MSELFTDLVGDLDAEMADMVRDELQSGWNHQKVLASLEIERCKAASDRIASHSVEGLGQHMMDVPADAYFAWKQKEGDCWSDRGFRDWFKKHNPATQVAYTPRRTTILT